MQHLTPTQRLSITITQNYDNLMQYRRNTMREQFKPLDLFYSEQRTRFNSNDVDLVDKAERYMEEAVTGNIAKRLARYDTSEET